MARDHDLLFYVLLMCGRQEHYITSNSKSSRCRERLQCDVEWSRMQVFAKSLGIAILKSASFDGYRTRPKV